MPVSRIPIVHECFAAAMRTFDYQQFDPVAIRQWAEGFSRPNFRSHMQEVVDAAG